MCGHGYDTVDSLLPESVNYFLVFNVVYKMSKQSRFTLVFKLYLISIIDADRIDLNVQVNGFLFKSCSKLG